MLADIVEELVKGIIEELLRPILEPFLRWLFRAIWWLCRATSYLILLPCWLVRWLLSWLRERNSISD